MIFDLDREAWSSFVRAEPAATPFHHPAWASLLAECYGYRAFAAAVADRDVVRAGVPMLEVRRPLGGRRWLALPFTDVCEPLAADAGTLAGLAAEIERDAAQAGVARAEVRGGLHAPGWAAAPAGVIHTLALDPDPDAVRRGFTRSHVRKNIATAVKKGVEVRTASRPADLVEGFYRLHVLTRRRHGTPVQPRRFFELLWARILEPGLGFCLLASVDGEPAAGAVFLAWNGTLIYKYAASDERFRRIPAANLVLWEAIRRGCENGCHTLDLGRTDVENQGLRDFKSAWGAVETPLVYSAFGGAAALPSGASLPRRSLERLIRTSPPIVCRALGQMLYRYAA